MPPTIPETSRRHDVVVIDGGAAGIAMTASLLKRRGDPQPTFPRRVNDGTRPSRRAWWLKARQLPWLYWHGMFKGREWLARPARRAMPRGATEETRGA